jgi:hypothetical protein
LTHHCGDTRDLSSREEAVVTAVDVALHSTGAEADVSWVLGLWVACIVGREDAVVWPDLKLVVASNLGGGGLKMAVGMSGQSGYQFCGELLMAIQGCITGCKSGHMHVQAVAVWTSMPYDLVSEHPLAAYTV